MARHLARSDRDALHGVLRDDLRYCSYIAVAIKHRDYASARTVASRYQAEFRLLDDLGWHPNDDRQQFELTLSDDQLAQVALRLLNAIALTALEHPDRATHQDPEIRAASSRDRHAAAVCTALLQALPAEAVRSAAEPLPGDQPC